MSEGALLSVADLRVRYDLPRPHPFAPKTSFDAVDGVSFAVERGRTLGIVGESGSGKTSLAMAVMRLTPVTGGRVELDGTDLVNLQGTALRRMRRRLQIVFQDPMSSLNPRRTAGEIIREPLDILGLGSRRERDRKVGDLLQAVGLRPEQRDRFPHQFSGGQRQRIGIARALSTQPDLIICDEPVSALDVAIQAQILNLLVRLQESFGLTYLFISHDLGVIQHISDDVAVMYRGRIVEKAPRRAFFTDPRHPYSRVLMDAVPRMSSTGARRMEELPAEVPVEGLAAGGCRFLGRCRHAEPVCGASDPELRPIAADHVVACHLAARFPVG